MSPECSSKAVSWLLHSGFKLGVMAQVRAILIVSLHSPLPPQRSVTYLIITLESILTC